MSNRLMHAKWLHLAIALLLLLPLPACKVTAGTPAAGPTTQAENTPTPTQTPQVATASPAPTATPSPAATLSPVATPSPTTEPKGTEPPSGSVLGKALEKKPFSLISDRLFIQAPMGSQDVARQQGIMYAPRSEDAETRLMLEGNGQTLVVYAQETFYYSDDLNADLDQLMKIIHGKSFSYKSECVSKGGDGFTAFHVTPDQIDTSGTSVLIREAVIANTDKTVITVGVYVTPDMAKDLEACRKQADRILKTIQPGTRKWLTKAHDGTIAEELNIKLDKDYVLVCDTGADFLVYYLMKIINVGEPAPSIGIYIGQHPTLMFPQKGIKEDQLIITKDTVLNTKLEWWAYKPNPDKADYSAETVFNLPRSKMLMHIFIDAADEAEFQKIKEMVKTMKFK